jgi:hypothetical protein
MSTLSELFTSTYVATRKTTGTATGADTSAQASTGLCLIRPVKEKSQLFVESNWGKEFKLWCDDDKDIKISDLIVIDSVTYTVQAVTDYTDLDGDSESHLEVRMYKK